MGRTVYPCKCEAVLFIGGCHFHICIIGHQLAGRKGEDIVFNGAVQPLRRQNRRIIYRQNVKESPCGYRITDAIAHRVFKARLARIQVVVVELRRKKNAAVSQ